MILDLPDRLPPEVERLTLQIDELRRVNATLAGSNLDLERFAAAASHDLQEPLRTITVYGELLAQRCGNELDADSAMLLKNIIEGGHRMKALLADLLTYAEIGADTDESFGPVDLNVVLENVGKNLQASIEENGATVVSAFLPTLPAAREFHFIQLFQNLIGNAIRYRGEANPLIRISVREADGALEFAVSDNGLGVAPKHYRTIFEAFKRLHDNRSPGTGIGLAICRRVVERYGGRIWVDSHSGHGATFRFTLPNVEVRPHGHPPARRPASKVRVVAVDDNPADVGLLRVSLEKAGLNCELTVISDGDEALAWARQQGKYAGGPVPDLAVLDFNLPKTDGLHVLQAMRDNRALAGVPVAVLSSCLPPRDVAKIQEFNLARHFPKPAMLEDFLDMGSSLKALIACGSNGRRRGASA